MSSAAPTPSSELPADDRAVIEALLAACIEALERGEQDPATHVCAARPELLPRVQRRLAQLAARGLIPSTDGHVPEAIGPYRIVRELGSGGMGSVYLAEQGEPVRRLVALKVIKLGMDTREVVARFQAERQALALMSHPNIAQVFEAGITPAGRPYFVMEYVEGLALTHFCDRRLLLPEARVQLLATVCRAVQHAHDRGFVHRDLKPSNVLVAEHDGVFVPKIIDFGIVKAMTPTAGGADPDSPRTRADEMLGTPEYMSPEQAASGGLHVDARTDVYSLGAMLYELLCGEMPFDSARLRRGSRGEMERILQDELPTLPSKRLARVADAAVAARGKERTALRRRIAGELDWITLKALAKDPAQRYATALAFAEDLERWLRNEAVLAAPPTRTYRLRKFVRRHRTVVLASAAALVATAGSWLLVTRAAAGDIAQVEKRAVTDSEAVANQLVERADDPRVATAAQTDELRQVLVRDALALYEKCMRDRPTDVALRKGRCNALIKLSKVQWQLGRIADAERSGTAAVAEARGLLADGVDDLLTRGYFAEAARRAGRAIFSAGRPADARPLLEEAVQHLAVCSAEAPDSYGLSHSSAWRELATALHQMDQTQAGLAALRKSVEVLVGLAAAGSKDAIVRRDLVIARSNLANQLVRAEQFDEAEAVLATAMTELAALPAERARVSVMLHYTQALLARRRDDGATATAELEHAAAAAAQWCRDEPGRLQPNDSLSGMLDELAQQHEQNRDFAAADAVTKRAVEHQEGLRRTFPDDPRRPAVLAITLYVSAHNLWDRHRRADLDQAHAWALRARDEHAVVVAKNKAEQPQHLAYTSLLLRIGDSRGDDTAAAWEEIAQALPVDAPATTPGYDHHFDAWIAIAASRLRHGQLDDVPLALSQARRVLDTLPEKAKGERELAWSRARLALRTGDATSAAAAAERMLEGRPRSFDRWGAADCLLGAASLAGVDEAQAAAWRDRADGLFRAVVEQLAGDVARDPLDPWHTLPWACSSVQLAGLEVAKDRAAAQQRLVDAVPVLERIRDHTHRDVWQDDLWQRALELQRTLAEPR